MSPHKNAITKGQSIKELPILPFLAPRILKPWPRQLYPCRSHGPISSTAGPGYESESKHMLRSRTMQEPGASNFRSQKASWPGKSELRDIRAPRVRYMSTSMDNGEICTDDERFRRAYADIWGPELAKRRFKDSLYLVPEAVEDTASIMGEETVQSALQENERRQRSNTSGLRHPQRARERLYRRVLVTENDRMPQVRTKYIRLTPQKTGRDPVKYSGRFSLPLWWPSAFAGLSRKYDSLLSHYRVNRPFRIRRIITSARIFTRSNISLQEIQEAWEALPRQERELLWAEVMLDALERRPSWALQFLIATTSSKHYPPSYAISDSIEHVVCFFLYRVENADARSVTVLFRIVMELLDKFDHSYLHLSQKTVFWLLSHMNIDEAEHFYKTLVHRNHPIHENTILQFAYAFAWQGRTQLAIDLLQSFHDIGGDFVKPEVESVCAKILQRKHRSNEGDVLSDSDIFSRLLDLGLRPNIILYNIVLQNVIESGDSETAWKILDIMPGLGIEANAETYSILLNDAKLNLDRPAMERIVGLVESKGIKSKFIVTDLLHAILLTHEQERRATARDDPPPAPLKRMFPLYAKYFDPEPLRDLLPNFYKSLPGPSDGPKMHPSKETLVVMFTALLRGFTDPNSVTEWYSRFRTSLLSGNPDIVLLAQSTHIYDAVIMSMGKWPVTLPLCTRVISDMFSSYSAAQAQKGSNLPAPSGKSLHTNMDSSAARPANHLSNTRGLPRDEIDCRIGEELHGLQEAISTAGLCETVSSIEEDNSGGPKQVDFSPTLSEVVADVSELGADQPIIHGHCKPSVHTWSVLLKAFMDNKQPRAAEKVLNMMQRQGITPSKVTWFSLTNGYARLQDVESTVGAIDRLENEGWEADDMMISGLQVIENRKALMKALKKRHHERFRKDLGPALPARQAVVEPHARKESETRQGFKRRMPARLLEWRYFPRGQGPTRRLDDRDF